MNTRTTLVVLLIALLLGVYFIVFETDLFDRKTSSQRELTREEADEIPKVGLAMFEDEDAFVSDDVQSLRLAAADQPAVAFQRHDEDEWTQTEPVRFDMSRWQINDIARDAAELRYTNRIDPSDGELSLVTMQLDPPRLTLTISGQIKPKSEDEGEGADEGAAESAAPEPFSYTLKLGKRTAAGRAYVQRDDESVVYIVNDDLHKRLLDKPLPQMVRDMRSRSLKDITVGRARLVMLMNQDQTINLIKRDDRWALAGPVTGRADREKVDQLIKIINDAYISTFVTDQPASAEDYGFDKPTAVLTVEEVEPDQTETPAEADAAAQSQPADASEDAQTQPAEEKVSRYTLTIGAPEDLKKDNYFAMWGDQPVVFTLSKTTIDKLDKTVDDLRDPRLTPVPQFDLREVAVARGDDFKIRFVKDQGAWQFGDPKPDYDVENAEVSELIDALVNTKADEYIADPTIDQPDAIVTLVALAQPQDEVLHIVRRDDGKVMVVRQGESTGYVVDADDVKRVFADTLAYRKRTVMALTRGDIAEARLIRTGPFAADHQFKRQALQPEGPSPELPAAESQPAQTQPDEEPKIGDWLLEGFEKAAFDKLIGELAPLRAAEWVGQAKAYVPEGVTIDLTLNDGTQHKLILHTDAAEAEMAGLDLPFKVDDGLVDAANAEFRSRTVLDVELDDLASVGIGDLTVKRSTDKKYSLDGEGELDESNAADLFDALAGLRVEHYLPAAAPDGDATTLTLTTHDGQTHTLTLWPDQAVTDEISAQLGDKHFTLSKDTVEKLTAGLTKPESDDGDNN